MKGLGYLLLSAGFIVAAYATALDVENVGWPLFAAAVLGAVAGVFMIKRHARSIAQSEEVLENNRAELRESIDNVVKDLRAAGLRRHHEPFRGGRALYQSRVVVVRRWL